MIVKKLLIICITFALLSCNNEPAGPISGDGTHTGNALVTGYLYSLNSEPANGAKVYFVKVNYNPHSRLLEKTAAIADTVLTNNAGQYSTNDLDTGTYNVYGVGLDGSMSLLNAVSISGVPQTLPSDTLKMPGSLSGFIKMQGADDPRTVFVIPLGTNGFINANINKSFNLTNLAEGSYSVRFLSTLDRYVPLDTVFTITASSSITLQDSIVLPLRIPIPIGFKISYDTLKQIVSISWNKTDSTLLRGYNIYRQHTDSAEVKLNIQPLINATYVDSTGVQNQTYIYSVVAVDFENKEGIRVVGDSVKLMSAYSLDKVIGSRGVAASQFDAPKGFFIRHDTMFIVENGNKRVQLIDTAGNSLLTIDSTLVNPQAIYVFSNKIYVADNTSLGNASLKVYNTSGTLLKTIAVSTGIIHGVKTISEDSILIVGARNIYLIDTLGMLRDSSNYIFNNPRSIAFLDSKVVVADMNVRKLVFLSYDLLFQKEITIISSPTTNGRGNALPAVSVGSQNNIYVSVLADFGKVILLDSLGNVLAKFTVFSDSGDFTYPNDLFAMDGKIYVLSSNSTIQVYKRK